MKVKLYIEGAGPGKEQDAAFRQGWHEFLEKWNLRRQPSIVRGQSREKTWDLFKQAVSARATDEIPILLVDSETVVESGHSSWQHLAKEGWQQPEGSGADDAFLMICVMETWILAGWKDEASLTKWPNLERVDKETIVSTLKRISGNRYEKGRRSVGFLGETNAVQVAEKCQSARELQARLQSLLGRR